MEKNCKGDLTLSSRFRFSSKPAENNAGSPIFALRRYYLDILQRRIGELHHLLECSDTQPFSLMEAEAIHLRIHNLVGSAAIYGYAAVCEAALRLDTMMNGNIVPWGTPSFTKAIKCLIEEGEKALHEDKNPGDTVFTITPAPQVADTLPILLTVDDDPAIHALVQALLGDSAKIISAYNSDEAIEAICRHNPDLVLLDNCMPGVHGLVLLENLRGDAQIPPAPVMMLTAEKQPFVKAKAIESGIVDYIAKPFDPAFFAEKVKGFLNRFRLTVLAASENERERRQLCTKLREQGLEVLEASSIAESLMLAEHHVPELIIIDQCMLGAEKDKALRMLRSNRHTHSIPVLYLTVSRRGGHDPADLHDGVTDHIVLPFVASDIVTHALEILDIAAKTDS